MGINTSHQKDKLMPNEQGSAASIETEHILKMGQGEVEALLKAISKSSAMIEFSMDGKVIWANNNFLDVMGYDLAEIVGKHHKIFCDSKYVASDEYKRFWQGLNAGKYDSDTFERTSKRGETIWLQASYNPLLDEKGKPYKVLKIASNITAQKQLELEAKQITEDMKAQEEELRQNMEEMQATQEEMVRKQIDIDGTMSAINSSFAFIEFQLDGTIILANDNFLDVMKYSLNEIAGKHHSIFVDNKYANSLEYKQFWNNLRDGQTQSGEFKRIDKFGNEVWIMASYTPVLDMNKRPIKIMKLATEITADKMRNADFQGQLEAIGKSNAVIEFNLDGTIIKANENFLNTLGYNAQETIGKHHRMFCEAAYANGNEYKLFWEKLNRGEFISNTFKRLGKNGNEIYIQASYNPIMDLNGNPFKVVKYATDVTEVLLRNADFKGQLEAIGKSNAVIEFNLDGTVMEANSNFLDTLGYAASEIVGKHHRMFCESAYANSNDYKLFWEKLNRGEYVSGTFKRLGKGGKEIYIQASYNPILDLNGKPFKVVKYATDVTAFTIGFQAATTLINEIRNGNFNAVIDTKGVQLEGDVAQVNQDLIGLQTMLKEVISEVNRVVNLAGREGQLRERLNITGLAGSWGELTNSLNELLISISEPILEINKIVANLSMGNLTQRFEKACRGDIKEMGNALNLAIFNINKILKEIEKSSFTVASSSIQMMKKSDSMTKNTTEVSAAIQQMASGAQEQAMRTDESSKLVEGILKSANEMGDKAETINTSALKGQQSCLTGLKVIKDVVGSMSDIAAAAETTSTSVEVLANRSEDISRTLNVITDIASQTNLLALNAAIEAARAGDAGRGFAVVAEEIRKLAEDSRKSAVDIDRVIKDVQKDINSAGKAIDKMRGSVTNGNSASKEAENVFQEINVSSAETLTLSKEILNSSKTTKDAIGTVVKNIEKIVVVSEEVAAGTQEIANSALELNRSMAEVSSTSTNMASVAEELKRGVDQFKLTSNV